MASGFSKITVEDTGPGLDGATSEDQTPGALNNIRERLAACGATFDVYPREGGGTVAVIRIPHRAETN